MAGLYKNTRNVRETDEEATQQAIADRINEESEQEERRRVSSNKHNSEKLEKAEENIRKRTVGHRNNYVDAADPIYKYEKMEEEGKDKNEVRKEYEDTENDLSTIREERKKRSSNERHTRRADKIAKVRAYQNAQQESDTDEEKTKKNNINDTLSGSWKGKRAKDMNDEEFKEFYHALTD